MFSYGSFRSDEVGLYFMPVMAIPSTKRFCTKKKTTSNGSAEIRHLHHHTVRGDGGTMAGQHCEPAVMVRVSGLEVMINGQSRSFQLPMKLNMPTVRMAGTAFGRMICAKMRNSPAPSMRAALSRSFGMEMKN